MLALNIQLESSQIRTAPQGLKGELVSGGQTESFSSMLESISKASARDGRTETAESRETQTSKRSSETKAKKTNAKETPAQKTDVPETETDAPSVAMQLAQVSAEEKTSVKQFNSEDFTKAEIPEITLDQTMSQEFDSLQNTLLVSEEIPDIELPDFDSLVKEEILDSKSVDLSQKSSDITDESLVQSETLAVNAGTVKPKDFAASKKETKVTVQDNLIAAEKEDTEPGFESLRGQEVSDWRDLAWNKPVEQEKPVFTVTDLRSPEEKLAAAKQEQHEVLDTAIEHTSDNTATMTLTLSTNAEQNILSSNAQSAASSSSNFQQMLAAQIQQNAPDFVKATNFVLRDSNQGTIDMILKPEQLGNVKVSLQVSDKVIAGQITVASKEALEAFKQNLETLKQALIQNGFENATLTLSMSDGSAANNSSFAQHGQADRQFRSERVYGQYASDTDSQTDSPVESDAFRADGTRYAIDVVA